MRSNAASPANGRRPPLLRRPRTRNRRSGSKVSARCCCRSAANARKKRRPKPRLQPQKNPRVVPHGQEKRDRASRRYFSDELIDENLVLTVLPMPLTAVMITMLSPTAIRQYSIAVAPDSSSRNREISCRIQNSCRLQLGRNLNSIGYRCIEEDPEWPVNRTGF